MSLPATRTIGNSVALAVTLFFFVPDLSAQDGSGAAAVLKAPADATAANGPVAEPSGYRMDDFRKPVPATLAGARVIDTIEAEKVWKAKAAIMVDVFPKPHKPVNLPATTIWRDPQHETIAGAHWLPDVGYGALPSELEAYFRRHLTQLTGAEPGKPLMFFCQRDCWMSWNAAKRAIAWGYSDVIWYPDGTDGWQEAGNDVVTVSSLP